MSSVAGGNVLIGSATTGPLLDAGLPAAVPWAYRDDLMARAPDRATDHPNAS